MREDIQTLKNDWLTDNVSAHQVNFPSYSWQCTNQVLNKRWYHSGKSTFKLDAGDFVALHLKPIIFFTDEEIGQRYLEHEHLSKYSQANIILLRPSMSFMLLQTSDPLSLRDALPDFTKATHIFLPINDCRNKMEAEGGTHWSLLVVSRVDRVAFHYDSLPPGNMTEAGTITRNLGILMNCPMRWIPMEDSPQQENSNDCGVFVCLSMRYLLLKKILRTTSNQKVNMSLAGQRVDATAGRREMLKIIEEFRKEGVRRRSYVLISPSYNQVPPHLHFDQGMLANSSCLRQSSSPSERRSRSPPRIEWFSRLIWIRWNFWRMHTFFFSSEHGVLGLPFFRINESWEIKINIG